MKIWRAGSTRLKPARPVPQLTRRRFCFLGVGVAIVGALDPRALLPRYTSALIGFKTEVEYQAAVRRAMDGPAVRRLSDTAWLQEATAHRRIVSDPLTCETIYRNERGVEIFRISDASLRLIQDGAGEFLDPSRPPSLASLGILWRNDSFVVLSPRIPGGTPNADHTEHRRQGLQLSRADRGPDPEV